MTNWLPTSPLLTRPPSPPDLRDMLAAFDGWSIADLMRNERFTHAPDESLPLASDMNERAEPTTAWQPDWLANAQWQSASEIAPWPEPPLMPRPSISEDPFERAALSTRRPTISHARRRPPMGPPFVDVPPLGYPSHLAPIPQAPDWPGVVSSPTSRSPLTAPPRATDAGRATVTIDEVAEAEDARRAGAMRIGQWRRRNQRPYEGYTAPPPAPPADDGNLGEHARLNLLDSYYRGSLFGAARLALMKMLNELPDGGISPATKSVRNELRKEYQQIRADLGRYDRMPSFQNPTEFGTAALGQLGGAMLSPESLAGLSVKGGALLERVGKAALQQGAISGGADPIVQGLNISSSVQKQYDQGRMFRAVAIGALLGGGAQSGTEVLGKLAARWPQGFGIVSGEAKLAGHASTGTRSRSLQPESDHIIIAARLSGDELGRPAGGQNYRELARQYGKDNLVGQVVINEIPDFPSRFPGAGSRRQPPDHGTMN